MKSLLSAVAFVVVAAAFAGEFPRVWTSYSNVYGLEEDLAEMKARGVDVADLRGDKPAVRRHRLAAYRAAGMKGCLSAMDITGNGRLIEEYGLMPEPAQMIAGVYRGLAIDRAVFSFSAAKHSIVVEPPVYNQGFPFYHRETRTEEGAPRGELMAHYYPAVRPVRAEVVVPLADYDGEQHLKIVPAELALAPEGTVPENDTVDKPEWKDLWEVKHRKLVTVSFDLTGLEHAQLDKVSVAVYWTLEDQDEHNMFRHGQVAPGAPTTVEVAVREMKRFLDMWKIANGGTFPSDVVAGLRLGDECFNPTGHENGPAVNCPLWNCSASGVRGFAAQAKKGETYPRVAGRPDIYGRDAYACWLYNYHRQCADLIAAQVRAAHEVAPNLIVLRNTTRGGSWSRNNDHDGSSQELLTAALDVVNLDPYPVSAGGYRGSVIPMDMAYNVGLSRRYGKPIVPWMQAHCYGGPTGLVDVTPEQVDRMAAQQYAAAPDGIMWLGYGATFPLHQPESWLRAAAFHERLHRDPPKRGKARLAVLRDYGARAVRASVAGGQRNPADAMLESFCHEWAVRKGLPYDVFEIPPRETATARAAREALLAEYEFIVSTAPHPRAIVIGEGTEGTVADGRRQQAFAGESAALIERLVGKLPDVGLNTLRDPPRAPLAEMPSSAEYMAVDLAYRRLAYYESESQVPGGAADARYKRRYLLFRRLRGNGDFWAGVYPVTQYQWVLVKNRNPSLFQNLACWQARPVENVSFEMIRGEAEEIAPDGFLFALRKMFDDKLAFDLPTEDQWDRLARAGERGALPSGLAVTDENVRKIARNFGYVQFPSGCTVAEGGTSEVGSYAPNAFGLYDTLGNVFEFCRTWHSKGRRVIRGGAYNSPIANCTFTFRAGEDPKRRSPSRGFRLVVPIANPASEPQTIAFRRVGERRFVLDNELPMPWAFAPVGQYRVTVSKLPAAIEVVDAAGEVQLRFDAPADVALPFDFSVVLTGAHHPAAFVTRKGKTALAYLAEWNESVENARPSFRRIFRRTGFDVRTQANRETMRVVSRQGGGAAEPVRGTLTAGVGQADVRFVTTGREGRLYREGRRLFITFSSRAYGSALGVASLDPADFDVKLEGMILFDYGDGLYRNDVAAHLFYDDVADEWRAWTSNFSTGADIVKGLDGRREGGLNAAWSKACPLKGLSVMRSKSLGLTGMNEDPSGVWDSGAKKWRLLVSKFPSSDAKPRCIRAAMLESDRWDGGFRELAGPVPHDSTGTTIAWCGGRRWCLSGSAERRMAVYSYPQLGECGELRLDSPPWTKTCPNGRVWPCFAELNDNDYILLTMDRENFPGMPAPNWTYGKFVFYRHCQEFDRGLPPRPGGK